MPQQLLSAVHMAAVPFRLCSQRTSYQATAAPSLGDGLPRHWLLIAQQQGAFCLAFFTPSQQLSRGTPLSVCMHNQHACKPPGICADMATPACLLC